MLTAKRVASGRPFSLYKNCIRQNLGFYLFLMFPTCYKRTSCTCVFFYYICSTFALHCMNGEPFVLSCISSSCYSQIRPARIISRKDSAPDLKRFTTKYWFFSQTQPALNVFLNIIMNNHSLTGMYSHSITCL